MAGPDDLLTTGEVAKLLGTTSRHVVQLADRGELPYTLAGTHRRIRRADAEALAGRTSISGGGPMTEDQLRSLWLGRVAAARVAREPEATLAEARRVLQHFLAGEPAGEQWLRHWLVLIERGPEAVMRALTSTSPLSRELRQNSPFTALIPDEERREVIAAFRQADPGR